MLLGGDPGRLWACVLYVPIHPHVQRQIQCIEQLLLGGWSCFIIAASMREFWIKSAGISSAKLRTRSWIWLTCLPGTVTAAEGVWLVNRCTHAAMMHVEVLRLIQLRQASQADEITSVTAVIFFRSNNRCLLPLVLWEEQATIKQTCMFNCICKQSNRSLDGTILWSSNLTQVWQSFLPKAFKEQLKAYH